MKWRLTFLPEAEEDFDKLDGSQKIIVRKALAKIEQNPLPSYEGGYGKPLGNKGGKNLSNFLKVKIKGADIRIVYQTIHIDEMVIVIIIGMREDFEVYEEAFARVKKYELYFSVRFVEERKVCIKMFSGRKGK